MWLAILVACLVLPLGAMTSAANAEEGAAKQAKAAKPERKKGKGADKAKLSPEERLKQRFEKLDADQSGTVSLDEFKSVPRKKKGKEIDAEQAKAQSARLEQRFKSLDADGNGELTLEEMKNPPQRVGKEPAGKKKAKKDRPNKKAAP
jgi:Ca2+-binding EF-hand superfamily protein